MKIIQIATIPETESNLGSIFALGDDGSVWTRDLRPGALSEWFLMDPPQYSPSQLNAIAARKADYK